MALSKIYIDAAVADNSQVASICNRLDLPVEYVNNPRHVYEAVSASTDPVKRGKEVLFLTKNRGAFLKSCPGTRHYTCCDYLILNIGTYCSMDCSYCIMQSYFHPPVLQFYVNHEELNQELERCFSHNSVYRIGTGEFTDSLIWEFWTDMSTRLIPRFSNQSHAVLELKTKTNAIENLKGLVHKRKTIVSWSLNTDEVIAGEERSTASLSARLRAAAKCESWGYPLGFHFDPMLIYDGCEKDYQQVVAQLFDHVSADNIVWISLGTFRFMPPLKAIVQQRFPKSKIVYGEFISGLDGKMRYFKPLRIELYRKMASWIREYGPDIDIYFCMEDDEVWRKALGFVPEERGGLPRILDESAIRHCGLNPTGLQ
jgi:spore photoproduct lyase